MSGMSFAKFQKNGSIHNGKQKYECKECVRQFVEYPQNKTIPEETWDSVDKLLLEKIPTAGIFRVINISEPWLQRYINQKYEDILQKTSITKKTD